MALNFLAQLAISAVLTIGSMALNKRTQDGPRVKDRRVQRSDYGATIQRGYGRARTAGVIIWAPDLVEVKESKKVGSLFGIGGTRVNEYKYFANIAVAVADGQIKGIRKIWANGKLIYDVSEDTRRAQPGYDAVVGRFLGAYLDGDRSSVYDGLSGTGMPAMETVKALSGGGLVRVYDGTQTRPDPLIVGYEGAGRCPAFTGTAYVVLENLPLTEDFGNAVPNIECEVIFSDSNGQYVSTQTDVESARIAFDADRGDGWYRDGDYFVRFNAMTGQEISRHNWKVSVLSAGLVGVNKVSRFCIIPQTGDIAMVVLDTLDEIGGLSRDDYLFIFDRDTAVIKYGKLINDSHNQVFAAPLEVMALSDKSFVLTTQDNGVGSLPRWMAQFVVVGDNYSLIDGAISATGGAGNFGSTGPAYAPGLKRMWHYGWDSSTTTSPYTLSLWDCENLIVEQSENLTARYSDDIEVIWYDHKQELLVFTRLGRLIKLAAFTTGFPEVENIPLSDPTVRLLSSAYQHRHTRIIYGSVWAFDKVGDRMVHLDLTTGDIIEQFDFDAAFGPSDIAQAMFVSNPAGDWIWYLVAGEPYWRRLPYPQVPTNGATLAEIVAAELDYCGMAASDYDVTALAGIPVTGWLINEVAPVRDSLEALQNLYKFDLVPVDGVLTAALLDRAPDIEIADNMVGAVAADVKVLKTRTQETELPRRVNLTHMDGDRDYRLNTQHAQRNSDLVNTTKEEVYDYSVVMSAQDAADIVQRDLAVRWTEMLNIQFTLTAAALAVQGGSIVRLTYDYNGVTYTDQVRVTDAPLGADYSLHCKGVRHGRTALQVVGTPADLPLLPNPDNYAGLDLPVRPVVMDLPTLSGLSDSDGGAYFGFTPDPPGDYSLISEYAALLRSVSGEDNFADRGKINTLPTGVCEDALPVLQDPQMNRIDWTYTVTVNSHMVPLSSSTVDGVLSGDNLVLIGDELIQYVTATPDGVRWILSGILRGRFGTDWATGSHLAGERVVYLDGLVGDLTRFGTVADLGKTYDYIGALVGSAVQPAAKVTHTHRCAALMPYAPAQGMALYDGSDVTITWQRRSRWSAAWQDGTGTVPVNEDAEAFEIDILNGENLVRTLTVQDAATAIYTAAEIAADAVTPTDLTVILYQISGSVGRGNPSPQIMVKEV